MQQLLAQRYAFVDVETTGFSPTADAVVEVAVLIVERGTMIAQLESLVDPGQPIPPYATAIHGICNDAVRGQPRLADLAPFVAGLCSQSVVVAHNASFDLGFLPFLRQRPVACSLRLATRVCPEAPNHKNQTLRAFFGVSDPALHGRSAHRALADTIVTRHIFFHCLQRYLARGGGDSLGELLSFLQSPRRQLADTV